ncbi:hypothetical protein Hanom_Chr09g00824651 [Helianthus anomalus]
MEKQTILMELEAGSKLAKKLKHQGVKWLFLKVWSKTVKVTKPQGAKRKFTLSFSQTVLFFIIIFIWKQYILIMLLKTMIHTGKFVKVVGPQYLSAARSYALAADSSSS